ncbi:transcriptional regulator [Hahella sp. CCB-MM4]|uniref:LysR family transcriptional regulator n=1 Tax=Hahella sp. (strain CCB-MM4) TaxID=1926491 RepID=UPI000B9B8A7A|nr:LysR family transcriptional regulator [Hahella sp. CCB-MM4]OZG71013.1 transcriptional regulator [Hahella sp. CCB-MM4]
MNRNRKLPPLHALKAFEATARRQSFSLAAEELNVTQGAISKQIKVLEDWYGAPLLQRTTKQLKLTEEGRTLSEHLTPMLDELSFISMNILERHQNLLRLLVNPTLAVRWLFPRLGALQKLMPVTQLRITTKWTPAEKRSDLEMENFDIVMQCARRQEDDPNLLREEQLIPACTPALLAQYNHDWRQVIRNSTLLHPTEDFEDWQRWLKQYPVDGADPESGLTFDTLDMPITLAVQGHGVALADPFFIMNELENGLLTIPRNHLPDSGWGYYMVTPANPRRREMIDIVYDWMHEEIKKDMRRVQAMVTSTNLYPLGIEESGYERQQSASA